MADGRVIEGSDPLVCELESLMRELLVRYERMGTACEARLEAIRHADGASLARCIGGENEIVQEIAELEKRRIGVVGRLAERLGSPARTQTTMSWIASRVADPVRGRLLGMATALREAIERVRSRNEVSRRAAESLAAHMSGLLRTVSQHLNHAKTYGRAGTVDVGPSVVSALDVTS